MDSQVWNTKSGDGYKNGRQARFMTFQFQCKLPVKQRKIFLK
jgi:hypothetical protein